MRPLLFDAAQGVAAAYLIAMMFSMGLTLGGAPAEDRHEKRRLRRLVLRGLGLNLVVLPLLAVVLTRALSASGDVAVALLLLAASPGGRFAPHLSRIAGAHLRLSVELTLFVAKLVSFTAPVTAAWMLHTHRVELKEIGFILQLVVLQLLPYLLGRRLRRRRPELAARLERPFALAPWVLFVAVLALALASRRFAGFGDIAGDRGWLAVAAFAVAAPALGWLVGGPAAATRDALALSGNARDLALALVIAGLAFAERDVKVAIFGAWLFLLLVNIGLARAIAVRHQRTHEVRGLQPLPEGGVE